MSRFKLVGYENGQQVIFKDYKNVEEAIKDVMYKDPSYFFIGDDETKRGYTIEEFLSTFGKENSSSNEENKEQTYIDLFEELIEEINTNASLEDQEIILNDKKYYFEEIYEDGWEDQGKYSDNYSVFRVSVCDKNGGFLEDLDMYIRQDCIRCGSYFSYYEYEYETPYLVKEKTETVVVKNWVAI